MGGGGGGGRGAIGGMLTPARGTTGGGGIELRLGGGPPIGILSTLDGAGIMICRGSSGCGVEPSLMCRLGADSWCSSAASRDVSLRYVPGRRS